MAIDKDFTLMQQRYAPYPFHVMKHPFQAVLHSRIIHICIALIIAFQNVLSAQCNGNINLFSQAAVNAFKATGCTKVNGDLTIRGEDITNLDSLILLTEVTGLFQVGQTSLTDLDGLSGLRKVGGVFNIRFNNILTSLDGVENLEEVGAITFENNLALSSILGLSFLKKINGHLYVYKNPALPSLNGLNLIDSIPGFITIDENDAMQDLTGLNNVRSCASLRIEQNGSLFSLAGLESLSHVPGGVVLLLNLSLTNVGGLQSLEHVGKLFWLTFCPEVNTLEGLALKTVTGTPLSFFEGLNISHTKVTNLKGLDNLEYVSGWLRIYDNQNLKNLDALANLRKLDGDLGIEDNVVLESIDGIANLEYILGELELTDNDSLRECSIESICSYLAAPAGLVLVWGNGPGCTDANTILSNCSPVLESHLVEANLDADTIPETTGDIRDLTPEELLNLTTYRAGVSADGVSKLLVRLRTVGVGRMEIANAAEHGIEFPWGDSAIVVNGEYYTFFLYTAPDAFNPSDNIYLIENTEAYLENIDYKYTNGTDVRQNHVYIPLVRPPVVLVHGTYSDPVQAWKTPVEGNVSMYDFLTDQGFTVFTVNYKESNGLTGFVTDNTGFSDNALVVWGDVYPQNTGGIKDALTYYRNQLGVSATQADVVGHSLGGVLARVYASENYNPDYKRPDNFMQGDINRLVTIGATHFGSHLGELQAFLNGVSPFDLGALDWLALQGVNLISNWFAPASQAVIDQIPPPMGMELGMIGRTEIPSHAIVMKVPKGSLRDAVHDPDESYYDMYWYITTLMYQIRDVREVYLQSKVDLAEQGYLAPTTLQGEDPATLYPLYTNIMLFKSMIEDAIHRAGTATAILDGDIQLPTETDIFRYALGETSMADFVDPLLEIFVSGADPIGVALKYLLPDFQFPSIESILLDQLKVNERSMEALRSLIFNNDDNDGVVRVQSQTGNLDLECANCVTRLDSVLHGFAPRYDQVQSRIAQLLRGNMQDFHPMGFPPVDQAQKLYYPSESLDLFEIKAIGTGAICQSGMPPSHAHAFAKVADEKDAIIIVRPINPDATPLVQNNAATKSMAVKPKSSNWGPQKGYIPVRQRYSKIWEVFEGEKRREKIEQYDHKVQENLMDGVALERELEIKACNGLFKVYIDEGQITGTDDDNAKDEVVLVPVQNPGLVCTWGTNYSQGDYIHRCGPRTPEQQLTPLTVLASPAVFEDDGTTPRFITADYDLLMIGFNEGPDLGDPMPPEIPLRPIVGQMTPEQEELMGDINDAIANTGYRGGQVVHHGPENQFGQSPYIDYPLTVFAPDGIPNGLFNNSTGGLILSIKMGPPGFRDLHLKQFVNRMRREGYDLYHNPGAPGWKWTWNSSAEAYNLEDAHDLADYVEELPKNRCDKDGNQLHSCPNDKPDVGEEAGLPTPASDHRGQLLQPNISTHTGLARQGQTWKLVDILGYVYAIGGVESDATISIDHSSLVPGMYFIVVDGVGMVSRFVKQ